jgi:hypothetical protein
MPEPHTSSPAGPLAADRASGSRTIEAACFHETCFHHVLSGDEKIPGGDRLKLYAAARKHTRLTGHRVVVTDTTVRRYVYDPPAPGGG